METQNPRIADRPNAEDLAQRLSIAALHQWKESFRGMIAFPAAMALSTAATAMFMASVVERAFDMIDGTLVDVGRRLRDDPDHRFEPRVEARPS
jgi:hypothetical protein